MQLLKTWTFEGISGLNDNNIPFIGQNAGNVELFNFFVMILTFEKQKNKKMKTMQLVGNIYEYSNLVRKNFKLKSQENI